MDVVIDIGNTRGKLGLFYGNNDMDIHQVTIDELLGFFKSHQVEKALISNVANLTKVWDELQKLIPVISVLTFETPMPIKTNYETPETLGVDRLAACVGARRYSEGNVLIIDAGSCITYDLLTENNMHQGGIISPGVRMRLNAMHTFTSNLPLVSFEQVPLEGKTTTTCLQSGAVNGTLSEMKGIIHAYQQKYQGLTIIIGGGDADFFDKNLELNTFVVPNLVLEGLHTIFMYNE